MENNKLTLEQVKKSMEKWCSVGIPEDFILPENIEKNIEKLKNKVIPDKWEEIAYSFNGFLARNDVIRLFGFSLVSYSWITPLSKWIGDRKCLEIMAGHGALSFALKSVNTSIIATDSFEWDGEYDFNGLLWTDVEKIYAVSAIQKYGKDVDIVICSWPDYNEDTATKCLLEMRKVNPNCVMLYIGEGYDGCTADDSFFETMEIVEDETFDNCFKGNYTRWCGINDYPMLVK